MKTILYTSEPYPHGRCTITIPSKAHLSLILVSISISVHIFSFKTFIHYRLIDFFDPFTNTLNSSILYISGLVLGTLKIKSTNILYP